MFKLHLLTHAVEAVKFIAIASNQYSVVTRKTKLTIRFIIHVFSHFKSLSHAVKKNIFVVPFDLVKMVHFGFVTHRRHLSLSFPSVFTTILTISFFVSIIFFPSVLTLTLLKYHIEWRRNQNIFAFEHSQHNLKGFSQFVFFFAHSGLSL